VHPYREAGLGVANTLSATLNMVLLLFALRRKLSRLGLTSLLRLLRVLMPAAVLAGIVAALLASAWEKKLGHGSLALKLGAVFVPGAIAGLIYWLMALAGRVPSAVEILGLLGRAFGRKTV